MDCKSTAKPSGTVLPSRLSLTPFLTEEEHFGNRNIAEISSMQFGSDHVMIPSGCEAISKDGVKPDI